MGPTIVMVNIQHSYTQEKLDLISNSAGYLWANNNNDVLNAMYIICKSGENT